MKWNVRVGNELKEACWYILVRIAFAYMKNGYNNVVDDVLATSMDAHRYSTNPISLIG